MSGSHCIPSPAILLSLLCLLYSTMPERAQGECSADCSGCAWHRKLLRMEGWLEHLLYFAADAAARSDWVQAAKALDTFSACVKHDAPLHVCSLFPHDAYIAPTACGHDDLSAVKLHQAMPASQLGQAVAATVVVTFWQEWSHQGALQAEMTAVNLLPLLDRLAGERDELLRRALLTAIAAMAQCGVAGEALPTAVREAWAEKVLPLHAWPHCSGTVLQLFGSPE